MSQLVALSLFNMKRQPSGDETTALRLNSCKITAYIVLVHLFISNIN